MDRIDVYIKVFGEGKIPVYSSENAAGCDLFATEDMVLRPGETKLMPLNFIMAIPPDKEAQIRPRSGLSLRTDLRVPNSPGTVDSDYRDPVGVILQNTFNLNDLGDKILVNPEILQDLKENYKEVTLKDYLISNNVDIGGCENLSILSNTIYIDKNGNPYGTIYIKKGDRIAQMVFKDYKRANFILHENPESIGSNRGGGFGHTGG